MSDNGETIVELRNVHKRFGSLVVLRGVNLSLERGKTTVIIGESGTGKSVLLKNIMGLIRPDKGEVYFEGRRVDRLKPKDWVHIRKQFGFLFQMGALFDSQTAVQNVGFPLTEHTHYSDAEIERIATEKLAMVGLTGIGHRRPVELSGGQRKRVALARAIALDPKVILYDEPTTGLDPIRSDTINDLIIKLQNELNVTSVVVTHDMVSAFKVGDRVIMLHQGQFVADGTPDEIRNSADPRVKRFVVGEADMNADDEGAADTTPSDRGDGPDALAESPDARKERQMNQRVQKVWIGLFVLGGLIATAIMIVKFGDTAQLLRQGYIVNAVFDKVIGVQEGTQVALAGIPVGRVKQVDLKNREKPGDGAIVAMQIRSEFSIPQGSTATTVQQLMGQPVINIEPPASPPPPAPAIPPVPRDGTGLLLGRQMDALTGVIDPKLMASVERTTARIGELAAALTPAAHDLHDLLQMRTIADMNRAATASAPGDERLTANLYTAVERLHSVLARIEQVVGDPAVQSNFKDTLANLRVASEDARQAAAGFRTFSQQAQQTATKADGVLTKLDATLDTTHRNIDELGKSLLANSDRMAKMLDNFVLASKDLAEGKGTMGMLLRDPKFYEELILTVQRLKEAAVDLQTLIRTWQKQGLLGAR